MLAVSLSTDPNISAWELRSDNTLTLTDDNPPVELRGLPAAAYLFGQALRSVQFQTPDEQVLRDDARFEFPAGSGTRVSLTEVSNALRYKFGVDPLIEFSSGMGVTGYGAAQVNAVLRALNREFAADFSLEELPLAEDAPPVRRTPQMAATTAELRRYLTEGGDLYVDREGTFFINGIRTTGMDVVVVSRLVAQDQIAQQYKTLMDNLARRNNFTAASRQMVESINGTIGQTDYERAQALLKLNASLGQQYGAAGDDMLALLTAGAEATKSLSAIAPPQALKPVPASDFNNYFTELQKRVQAMISLYTDAAKNAEKRRNRYILEGVGFEESAARATSMLTDYKSWLLQFNQANQACTNMLAALNPPTQTPPLTAEQQQQLVRDTLTEQRNLYGQDDFLGWIRQFDIKSGITWNNSDKTLQLNAGAYLWDNYSTNHSLAWDYSGDYLDSLAPNSRTKGNYPGQVIAITYDNNVPRDGDVEDDSVNIPNVDDHNLRNAYFDWSKTNWGTNVHQACIDNQTTGAGYVYSGGLSSSFNDMEMNFEAIWWGTQGSATTSSFTRRRDYIANIGSDKYPVLDNGGGLKNFMKIAESGAWRTAKVKFSAEDYDFERDLVATKPNNPSGSFYSVFNWDSWKQGTEVDTAGTKLGAYAGTQDYNKAGGSCASDKDYIVPKGTTAFNDISGQLNTVISNNVREGELDQAKLQAITAQLQNNTEAMTSLIKSFSDLNSALNQGLR